MSEKTYLIILKSGIYLSFLTVFFVFTNLLFPYIASKQISFNILIEILLVFWVAFIVKYPEARPKKSYISFGLIAFFAALLASSFVGVDFNLSFWGDVERMLGVFHLLHFLAFYFIIITVMRTEKDWKNLLSISIIAASLVGLFGIINIEQIGTQSQEEWKLKQKLMKSFYPVLLILFSFIIYTVTRARQNWRNILSITLSMAALVILYGLVNRNINMSTIGNTAYVSGYMIFNIYFALILFFRERSWPIKSLYLVFILIMLLAFKAASTGGAFVGMAISIIVLAFLYSILSKNKKVKIYTSIFLFISVASISVIFANRNSPFVQDNAVFSRITDEISFTKDTFQTRLISWRAAGQDFKNHPFLGTGHGNYAITFDKYFDPKFYSYTRSETYFDRAHNNIVDIVSTTGAIGLLTYLSIFAALGYYLIIGYRGNKINLNEFVLIIALIIAYFIQNLAVFDSLVTYISLMAALGFVHWLVNREEEEKLGESKPLDNNEIFVFLGVGLIMLAVIYQYNIKPLKMLAGTIEGQKVIAQEKDLFKAVDVYKKALSYNTPLDRDGRNVLIRLIVGNAGALNRLDRQSAQEVLDYGIELANANVEYNPQDSLAQMTLAQILDTTARFNASGGADTFYYYSNQALAAINKSIEASPGRVNIYFMKAQILMTRGERDEAIAILKYAVSLNEDYPDSICNLARFQISLKMEEEGYDSIDKCIDKGGTRTLAPAGFVKSLINHYIEQKGDNSQERLIKLYERLVWKLEPKNAKTWVNLSTLYVQAGNIEKAVEAAQMAAEFDPALRDSAEQFIRNLENSR